MVAKCCYKPLLLLSDEHYDAEADQSDCHWYFSDTVGMHHGIITKKFNKTKRIWLSI
jgi:hypothetical protein